ncbi:MAG TPA: hypothetical protein VM782_07745, partial [Stellaceae bacterium]|nr:hypothetical protein [Stellaceae bacterium]
MRIIKTIVLFMFACLTALVMITTPFLLLFVCIAAGEATSSSEAISLYFNAASPAVIIILIWVSVSLVTRSNGSDTHRHSGD